VRFIILLLPPALEFKLMAPIIENKERDTPIRVICRFCSMLFVRWTMADVAQGRESGEAQKEKKIL
jgi:hypothetical protein